ncbi:MAG: PAS domain S-box protein [Pseudomonadota bacterium]|nr:PAS domain S-box protein [Pseudomonadota bacterium]
MGIKETLNTLSIRKKLILLVIIALLPAAVAIGVASLREREHSIQFERHNALFMTESIAAQQEQIAVGTRQMLSTLAQLPEVQSRDAAACRRLFTEVARKNDNYSIIAAATPDGRLFASSLPSPSGNLQIADREYFRAVIRSREFSAGEYVTGRFTHMPVINYGYPVLGKDNELIAVVVAGLRLDKYADFIAKADLSPGSTVVITDRRGVRIYRTPEHPNAKPGLGVAEEVKKNIFGPREEGFYERTADDGVYRIYAYKKLRLAGHKDPYLYVFVGIPKQQLLDAANRRLAVSLAALSGVTLLLMSLAWLAGHLFFTKPIRTLLTAVGKFGGGDLSVRTGLPHTADEMGQMAKSFDGMAACLEDKARERAEMERKLQESEERYRKIIQDSNATMLLIDPADGRIVDANPAAARYYGYAVEELREMHIFDINTISTAETSEEMRRAESGQRGFFLFQHRLADGSVRPVEVYSGAVDLKGKRLLFSIIHDISARREAEAERERLIHELREALAKIKTLSGMLPICASCKKIRNDEGYWEQIEVYIRDRSEAEFSHSLCPDCKRRLYPQLFKPETRGTP